MRRNNNMKVLIFTVTTGQGHNQVANVLCDALSEKDIESVSIDAFEYITPVLKDTINRGYLVSTKRLPKVYGKGYRLVEKRDTESHDSMFAKFLNGILARKLVKFVEDYKPDVIVCTHVFAAIMVSYVANKLDAGIRTVGIVTDFTMHPYWEEAPMDYYVLASELLCNQAKKKGISEDEIVPTGIPINPRFAKKTDKQEARKILGLEDKTTILVMSGSMGYGKIGSMIKKLDEADFDFQILSVCGYNERLKKRIDKMEFEHKIFNYGYSDQIHMFMDAADCIVTKPGGLTTSEALAKGLPMIMANPIPGQEDRNVEFLLNNGAAFKISSTFPIDEALFQMFSNEVRLRNMSEMVKSLGKPQATKDFVDFVIKLGIEKGDEDEA
ncbi:MAG: glycosyltransferase [Ruminococcaceae bacterium]|nr:glycosyltransferase [Oscillospiraceae bacterium]